MNNAGLLVLGSSYVTGKRRGLRYSHRHLYLDRAEKYIVPGPFIYAHKHTHTHTHKTHTLTHTHTYMRTNTDIHTHTHAHKHTHTHTELPESTTSG